MINPLELTHEACPSGALLLVSRLTGQVKRKGCLLTPDSLTPVYIAPGVGSQIRTFGNARADNPSNGRDALRQDREVRTILG